MSNRALNNALNTGVLFAIFLQVVNIASADVRGSASYAVLSETVDAGGGLSASAFYSTIGSAGLITGSSKFEYSSVSMRSGYVGQLAELELPEIEVRQPVSSNLTDGGFHNFGTVVINASHSLLFTIKNTGLGDLTGLGVTIDGTDAALFSLTASPVALVTGPLGSTTFTVRFAPTSAGPKTAVLHIANNDADESPFDLTLFGNLSALELWRQANFASIENSGDGADMNDFDKDGLNNLTEFAFGLNPKLGSSMQLPQGQIIGANYVIFFNQNAPGITYGAEWTTSLQAGSWTPVPDTGIAPQHAFSVPIGGQSKMFMRLTVANP